MTETLAKRLRKVWLTRSPYALSLAMIACVTTVGMIAVRYLHSPNLDMLYLLVVLVSALKWGRWPGIFAAVVSSVVFDFCFIPPYFSFAISDIAYFITLFAFVIVALATSTLAARTRELVVEHRARERAEATSRAKDEILHKISHELRTPLSAVMGWTQMLQHASGDEELLARSLSSLEHSARAIARLVDDLLDASRISSNKLKVKLEPLAIAPVIAEAADMFSVAAKEKRVQLELNIEPAGEVLGDAQRMQQIVANLISNALKFTPEEGRVVVRVCRVKDEAQLVVSDTGIGIPRDFLEHAFDEFAQANNQHYSEGLGLGLSIVKYLVEAHHGTVLVESPGEERGSTFTVRIPILPDEPKETLERVDKSQVAANIPPSTVIGERRQHRSPGTS